MTRASHWLIGLTVILAGGVWSLSRDPARTGARPDPGPVSLRRSEGPPDEEMAGSVATGARSNAGPPMIAIRAIDHEGRPAVGIRVVVAANRELAGQSTRSVETRAPGGEVQILVEDLLTLARENRDEVFIGLALPCREPPGTIVPITPVPDEPLELRLPATGAIVVSLAASDGGTVRLFPDREVRDGLPSLARRSLRVPLQGGEARFPHVGLGLQFEISASLEGTTGRI